MPRDISLLSQLKINERTEGFLKAVGETDFIFEVFNNDVQFDSVGGVVMTEGTAKLSQGIIRSIITPIGSNIEDPRFGSDIGGLIGEKLDQEQFARARTEVIDSLIHYNELNVDNPNSDEVIETIDELQILQDLDDPRTMKIVIGVTTESGKALKVEVPQVNNDG